MAIQRVTMKEVAAVAGVSVSTVSRALRNYRRLPPATCRRIQEIAKKLGYAPDPLLSEFVTRRYAGRPGAEIDIIAYITAGNDRNDWRRADFGRKAKEGAEARAKEMGYRLEHFWLREPGMTGQRLSGILYNRGIRGVCIGFLGGGGYRHLTLEWDHFSCAAIGYSMIRPMVHRACPHQFQDMLLALRQLRRLNYGRIGVYLDRRVSKVVGENWLGAALAFQRLSPAASVLLKLDFPSKRESFEKWFTKYRPEVVLSDSAWALDWLLAMGLDVPRDVGFATLNCSKDASYSSGIDQEAAQVGAAAIDMIIGQIRRNESGIPESPRVMMVEGNWVSGETALPQMQIGSRHKAVCSQPIVGN